MKSIITLDQTVTEEERRAFLEGLSGHQTPIYSPSGPVWLNQQKAADYLGMSRWTLARLADGETLLQPVLVRPGTELYRYPVEHLRRFAQQRIAAHVNKVTSCAA